jgi:hypothetical protein
VLPGCTSDSITVFATSMLTVTVQDGVEAPISGVSVYGYNGDTDMYYYGTTTDGSGRSTFNLPSGRYVFFTFIDGVYYWSGTGYTSEVPGSTTDVIIVSP